MDSLHEIFRLTEARLTEGGEENLFLLFQQQRLETHFFPPFLRSRQTKASIYELAQLEWIQYEIRQNQAEVSSALAKQPVLSGGRVRLNPLSRWLPLNYEVKEWGLSVGLWLISLEERQIVYHRLQPEHAIVLDLLSEGLSLSVSELQVLAEAELRTSCARAIEDLQKWNVLQSDGK